MMIACTPENSWSELITSAPAAKSRICRVHSGRPKFLSDCEQSCTASLPAACHGWLAEDSKREPFLDWDRLVFRRG